MKSVILGLLVALMVTPAFAAGRSRRVYQPTQSKVYSIPTVGKTAYTIEHPSVAKPTCKDGKCSLRR